jgi:pilus assembly protein CpaB
MARIQELTLGGNNRALLILALIAGLIAAVVVFVAVSGSGDDGGAGAVPTGGTAVVVATQDISAGTAITEDMVEVKTVPDDLLLTGTYDEPSLVVGEQTKVAILAGEQLSSAKIGLAVPEDGLAGVVPTGMRAISLQVEEKTAVGGLLLPGDRVDVYVTSKLGRQAGLADDEYILRTELVLQDIEVLSVAQEAQEPTAQTSTSEGDTEDASVYSGEIPEDVEEQPQASTVTLALTPDQALILAQVQAPEYAEQIFTSLRPFGDHTIIENPQPVDRVFIDGGGLLPNLDFGN